MTMVEAAREPIPAGKFRAIEEEVKTRKETYLGDYNSFTEAQEQIERRFKYKGVGWYTYYIYNGAGKRIFIATTTKRVVKILWFIPVTKTTFVSEIISFQ